LQSSTKKDSIEWKENGWEYRAFGGVSLGAVVWRSRVGQIFEKLKAPDQVLKDDHRSKVLLIDLEGVPYIVKIFVLQKTWWWFRLTSLLFPTIGEIACENAVALNEVGLLTPSPSLLLQKRRFGMVIESLLVYPYLPGRTATIKDAGEIIEFVHRMHDSNWIHRDPHPANFLMTGTGLATIDPVRAKRSRSKYLKAYDVMLMEHDMPAAPALYGKESLGIHYVLAKAGHDFIRFYRKSKKQLRSILGLGKSGNLMNRSRNG